MRNMVILRYGKQIHSEAIINYKEAIFWFKKYYDTFPTRYVAPETIGECYRDGGYGISADRNEAIKWFRIAANNGSKDASKALREMGAR